MTGFEVVGVALALLPLMISAAENYNNCLDPFRRYRGFPNEAQRFLKLLRAQKTIFHNHCIILLKNFVDQDTATSILQTPGHRAPPSLKLENQLAMLLRESKEACIDIIEEIRRRLHDIERESQDLVMAINSEKQPKSETYISWRKRVTVKLRFSVSKSLLHDHLEALQSLNHNFDTLASQSLQMNAKQHLDNGDVSKEAKQETDRYNTVRKASQQVYEALRRACTRHPEHLAHTCALVEYTISTKNYLPQVKFRMALAGSSKQKDAIIFVVDATLEDSDLGDSSGFIVDLDIPERSLKRYLEKPPDHKERKVKKSVRFDTSVVKSESSDSPVTNIHDELFFDGRHRKDFCEKIQYCRSQMVKPHVCVGTLGTTTGCKTSIFLSTTTTCQKSQQVISLDRLLASFSDPQKFRILPLHQRLSLAKVLSIAVLQYRSTEWLQMSWNSKDVVFFATDEESLLHQNSALMAPHFNARVKASVEMTRTEDYPQIHNTSGARNALLYSLGIVLFEIARWESTDHCPDLKQARELLTSARLKGRFEMGLRYAEIVEKLIECDFGCGNDLSKSSLQTAVYRNVIGPLDDLEKRFRALQL